MNIMERTVTTYETEDGQVFNTLAEARAYALQAQGCNLIDEGIKVGEYSIIALREPNDLVAFMAAKEDEHNRVLFSLEEIQYPLFICTKQLVEKQDEEFVVVNQFELLINVIQQQQAMFNDLIFAFEFLSVQTIPEEENEEVVEEQQEVEEPVAPPDEPVEEEPPMGGQDPLIQEPVGETQDVIEGEDEEE